MSQLNRREFLVTAGVAAVVVSLPVLQVVAADAPPKAGKPVQIGKLSDYAKDGVTVKWAAKPDNFFVIRKDGKLFACSSLCTHRYYKLAVKDDQLVCNKHHSNFTFDGSVIDGPAKSSLPHYGISVDGKGVITVDPSKEFTEAKWEDAASFIKIDK